MGQKKTKVKAYIPIIDAQDLGFVFLDKGQALAFLDQKLTSYFKKHKAMKVYKKDDRFAYLWELELAEKPSNI